MVEVLVYPASPAYRAPQLHQVWLGLLVRGRVGHLTWDSPKGPSKESAEPVCRQQGASLRVHSALAGHMHTDCVHCTGGSLQGDRSLCASESLAPLSLPAPAAYFKDLADGH